MDWKESLIDTIVSNVGGLTTIAAIFMFCRMYWKIRKGKGSLSASKWLKAQFYGLLAKDVIWILLVIECSVFILSWPVFKWTQCTEVAMDYLAYAAPCLAGIFAGLGVMYQAVGVSTSASGTAPAAPATTNPASRGAGNPNELAGGGKKGASTQGATAATPRFRPEYVLYIISLVFLLAGYASYVWMHFAYKTIAWIIIWTGVAMAIGYLVPVTQRWFANPRGLSEPAILSIGLMLLIMLAALGWFVQSENAVFSGADAKYIHQRCDKE